MKRGYDESQRAEWKRALSSVAWIARVGSYGIIDWLSIPRPPFSHWSKHELKDII